MAQSTMSAQQGQQFENVFSLNDLLIFDQDALHRLLGQDAFGITLPTLACAVQHTSDQLVHRIQGALPTAKQIQFKRELQRSFCKEDMASARQQVLDAFFWELTYWKTPTLYEELTAGESLHPGIFWHLESGLHASTVLDVGAGSGRATFSCLRYAPRRIYAVEPSPGLRRILAHKVTSLAAHDVIRILDGCFAAIPLAENSVDLTLSCSAFTTLPEQGGEPGLAEMVRVTRDGGKVVLIWPRPEDIDWLAAHGFQYKSFSGAGDMSIRFRSLQTAFLCAHRFYGHNDDVLQYLLTTHEPMIPFSLLGFNPPCDYCWLKVRKGQKLWFQM